ncbi:Apicidin F synthase [Fulvia fulva]|nr:Apicidin F synthase [Fulvia fulva]WPV25922.1 Apicidin F synthase [Fulvia fulva]
MTTRACGRVPRLYKTGDLVRYGSDGQIFVVGRKDDQIKVNGIRTEPYEVENTLRSLLPQGLAGKSVIIVCLLKKFDLFAAFVCSGHDSSMNLDKPGTDSIADLITSASPLHHQVVECIRAHTSNVSYQTTPQLFIPISRVPYTTSGKTDRRALEHAASMLGKQQLLGLFTIPTAQHEEASSPLERQLADAWHHVLGIEFAGGGDNFFHLGGSSLTAIALINEVRRTMCMRLTMSIVFQHPVLHDMAEQLQGIDSGNVNSDRPLSNITGSVLDAATQNGIRVELAQSCALQPDAIEDAFPCTPMQETLMTATMHSMKTNEEARPYCMHAWHTLPDNIDGDRMRMAWQTVLARHEVLRSRIVHAPAHGTLLVICQRPESVRIWDDVSIMSIDDLGRRLEQTHFGYGTALFGVTIILQGPQRNRLVLSAHHAVYDGWSLRLIWDAVLKAYSGDAAIPAYPSIRFADFVAHLRAQPHETVIEFWKHQLNPLANRTGLVFPDVPSAHRPRTTQKLSRSLTSPTLEAWKAARNTGITMDTICHATWALVVALYSSSSVVTFGSTRTGRDSPLARIEELLGPTMTTVPFCLSLDRIGEITAGTFLKNVQRLLLSLAPHEHLGLQRISEISPHAKSACAFSSVLTVQAPRSTTVGRDRASVSVPIEHPSTQLGIHLLESVTKSGFHLLPLALQVFSDQHATNSHIEAYYDPVCISR